MPGWLQGTCQASVWGLGDKGPSALQLFSSSSFPWSVCCCSPKTLQFSPSPHGEECFRSFRGVPKAWCRVTGNPRPPGLPCLCWPCMSPPPWAQGEITSPFPLEVLSASSPHSLFQETKGNPAECERGHFQSSPFMAWGPSCLLFLFPKPPSKDGSRSPRPSGPPELSPLARPRGGSRLCVPGEVPVSVWEKQTKKHHLKAHWLEFISPVPPVSLTDAVTVPKCVQLGSS